MSNNDQVSQELKGAPMKASPSENLVDQKACGDQPKGFVFDQGNGLGRSDSISILNVNHVPKTEPDQ